MLISMNPSVADFSTLFKISEQLSFGFFSRTEHRKGAKDEVKKATRLPVAHMNLLEGECLTHICHGYHGQCPWRKCGHVEKFVHMTGGQVE